MSAITTPPFAVETPLAGGRKRRAEQRPTWKTISIVTAAYLIAFAFVFPYLDMIVTALRPQSELQTASILPHHYTSSSFTSLWRTGLGQNLKITLTVAGGAIVLVLLVALPAAYYTARHRFRGRLAFLLLVLVTQMFQPTAMLVGIYRKFFSFHLLNTVWSLILVNGLQSGLRSLDPQRVYIVDSA